MNEWDEEFLLAVLHVHPIVMTLSSLCFSFCPFVSFFLTFVNRCISAQVVLGLEKFDNFFYMPPQDYFG